MQRFKNGDRVFVKSIGVLLPLATVVRSTLNKKYTTVKYDVNGKTEKLDSRVLIKVNETNQIN